MAKYSSPDVVFKIDKADSGALQDITTYITKIGEVNIVRPMVDSTPFGTDQAEYLVSIFKKYDPITIEGFYDDLATDGPDAILNIGAVVHSVTRSFELTIGSTKKISGECWIVSYKRTFNVGEYTTYSAEIQITGTTTEA